MVGSKWFQVGCAVETYRTQLATFRYLHDVSNFITMETRSSVRGSDSPRDDMDPGGNS
jgi:hypothetical protein